MADTTGPISTLPGRTHDVPKNTMCDDHPERPATHRVQGETDSMGCEMYDMCQECFDTYKEEIKNADTSGTCDWCKSFAPKRRNRRDWEEGSSGRVYQVCDGCLAEQKKRLDAELAELAEYDDFDDYDEDDGLDDDYEDEDKKRVEAFYLEKEAADQEDQTWSVVLACSNTRNQYKMFTYYVRAKSSKEAVTKGMSWLPRQWDVDDPTSCRAIGMEKASGGEIDES